MLNVLLRPFGYLSIQHSDPIHKWINWRIPTVFALLTGSCWFAPTALDHFGFLTPLPADIWSNSGLVSKIQSFVQSLPGFYTAALAVVATFGSKNMLKVMPGEAPRMKFLVEGKMTEALELNRRLFLSSMFAYLTALSFLLTIGAAIGVTVAPIVKSMLLPWAILYVSAFATSVYILFFIQMLTVTGWGLYYLGERMHLSDGPEPEPEPDDRCTCECKKPAAKL